MKKLIFILIVFISFKSFSQETEEYKTFIKEIKKDNRIDKKDMTVLYILNDFYEQVLQSDNGELNENVPQKIQNLYADKTSKNLQILTMFLSYQDYVSQNSGPGRKVDSNFQINLINDLEKEFLETYGKIPAIVKIYKYEALQSNGQESAAEELLKVSLSEFPNSIPLKVYKYLESKDEKIRLDLIRNHSNHWMVLQNGIK